MKIKELDHIDTIFIRFAKCHFGSDYPIAKLLSMSTPMPPEAYSDFLIYKMICRTGSKVLSRMEFEMTMSSLCGYEGKDIDDKTVSLRNIQDNIMGYLRTLRVDKLRFYNLNDDLTEMIDERWR